MAINPSTLFQNLNGPDTAYPFGSAKNSSGLGLKDGTGIKAQVFNDIWGFLQRVLDEAGVVPSGNPDTVLVSQYYDALMSIIEGVSRGAVASETERGAIELATQAEVNAGTDAGKAITPATLSPTVSGPWNEMTLVNGWVAVRARYRHINNNKNLQVDIFELLGGDDVTSTTIAMLPATHRPAYSSFPNRNTNDGISHTLYFYTSGICAVNEIPPSTYRVSFSTIIPLD